MTFIVSNILMKIRAVQIIQNPVYWSLVNELVLIFDNLYTSPDKNTFGLLELVQNYSPIEGNKLKSTNATLGSLDIFIKKHNILGAVSLSLDYLLLFKDLKFWYLDHTLSSSDIWGMY